MRNGWVMPPQNARASSLQSSSACSRLHAFCLHHVPESSMFDGVSQYTTSAHCSHQLQRDVSVHAPQLHVSGEHVRDWVREPQVVQLTLCVSGALAGSHS